MEPPPPADRSAAGARGRAARPHQLRVRPFRAANEPFPRRAGRASRARTALRAPPCPRPGRPEEGRCPAHLAEWKNGGDSCRGRRASRRAVAGEAGAPRGAGPALPHADAFRAQRRGPAREAAAVAVLLAAARRAWADAVRARPGASLRGAGSARRRDALLGPLVRRRALGRKPAAARHAHRFSPLRWLRACPTSRRARLRVPAA